jgi:hypothetical protein
LSKHRSSDVQSAEYSASQEFYIERGAKNAMNGKLEYEYFRLQKLEKMFWNRTYGHVRIIYFSEKLTSMLMVNVLQDEKGQDIPEMVLSSRSKDTVRNSLTLF